MKITVNGKEAIIEGAVSVRELLSIQKVDMPDYVTVQINNEFILRDDFETLQIKENDVIEFLYFMGGGQE